MATCSMDERKMMGRVKIYVKGKRYSLSLSEAETLLEELDRRVRDTKLFLTSGVPRAELKWVDRDYVFTVLEGENAKLAGRAWTRLCMALDDMFPGYLECARCPEHTAAKSCGHSRLNNLHGRVRPLRLLEVGGDILRADRRGVGAGVKASIIALLRSIQEEQGEA